MVASTLFFLELLERGPQVLSSSPPRSQSPSCFSIFLLFEFVCCFYLLFFQNTPLHTPSSLLLSSSSLIVAQGEEWSSLLAVDFWGTCTHVNCNAFASASSRKSTTNSTTRKKGQVSPPQVVQVEVTFVSVILVLVFLPKVISFYYFSFLFLFFIFLAFSLPHHIHPSYFSHRCCLWPQVQVGVALVSVVPVVVALYKVIPFYCLRIILFVCLFVALPFSHHHSRPLVQIGVSLVRIKSIVVAWLASLPVLI